MNTLGDRIKYYRNKKGLTQKQLANMIGAKHNSVCDWEKDKNKPDVGMIERLIGVFGVDANTLLGWNEQGKIKKDAEELADKIITNKRIKNILSDITEMNDDDVEMVKSLVDRLMKGK